MQGVASDGPAAAALPLSSDMVAKPGGGGAKTMATRSEVTWILLAAARRRCRAAMHGAATVPACRPLPGSVQFKCTAESAVAQFNGTVQRHSSTAQQRAQVHSRDSTSGYASANGRQNTPKQCPEIRPCTLKKVVSIHQQPWKHTGREAARQRTSSLQCNCREGNNNGSTPGARQPGRGQTRGYPS